MHIPTPVHAQTKSLDHEGHRCNSHSRDPSERQTHMLYDSCTAVGILRASPNTAPASRPTPENTQLSSV